jgi:biopolymer transport protein TolR
MNVTPLVDVLLVLLIIFIVIGPTLPHGLESQITKPTPIESDAKPPVTVQVLASNASGDRLHYRIDGRETPESELQARLQESFTNRPPQDRTMYLMAERSLSYGQVAQIASLGRTAGAGAIALAPQSAR